MLGVDRLDVIKGIPQKLLAFEKFLEEHPEWRDKVLLVQIAVPSRTDVPEYQVRSVPCPQHSPVVPIWCKACAQCSESLPCTAVRPVFNDDGVHEVDEAVVQ